MGGHAWWYEVPYDRNVEKAMLELREREFRAGRYNPVTPYPNFPDTDRAPAKGARHASIEEAMEAADASGTRSILDMFTVGEEFGPSTMTVLDEPRLLDYFGTTQPTPDDILENDEFVDDIGRGEGRCVVLYDDGKPSRLLFIGFSFD
jgi:hypothetical protein